MTRRFGAFVLFLAALILSLGQPAFAHSPYTVYQTTLHFSDGRWASLEILYGDGIFWADPGRGQLRTDGGAIVARTPAADGVATFCPNIDYCWVFLSDWIPAPWRLQPEQIAWHSAVEEKQYPEFDDRPPVGFAADWTPWSIALGVAILIADHWAGLVAMLLPWLLIPAITRLLRGIERNSVQVWWSVVLCALFWIALILYELLATYVMVALSAFPLSLLVMVLAVTMFGSNRLLAWRAERRQRQPSSA